ncbi:MULTISPECIES: cytochrome c oxidase subunit II [unclassified Halomonas]|uniref:cytochrome c oxidase subunit II n=1 Tax=unclassified Halomonas TaxID=2609666 RepID=UPI0028846BF7|nr:MULTISPECIES: cytochrome c oxidase subunit II [unclassified Halomonas]MDT0499731.1 cytochrome c oxidase subunit II [Halomonas sp. PAR7]MDT0510452.1 cytochrome c oxidase subunit II [Halomonas sp. LES1]MDT0589839.1 cytochrome c oxidase subunit II [Halomonas sp. PAR8]
MRTFIVWTAGCLVVPLMTTLAMANGWNMPVGVTDVSREVHSLHMTIFWICVVIGVIVFGAMFYSLFRFRHSKGAKAAHFHEHPLVEVIWTAIPLLILIGMAVPATATLKKMYDPSDADLDVMITGQQWRWRYEYLGEDVAFTSNLGTPRETIRGEGERGEHYLLEVDEPLVLPVGRKVRFLMTSDDVIHSWWVPDLAVKQDTIPGFVNENWVRINEPGVYRGQCAELCGMDHGFMPIVVQALEEEEFDAWLAERKEAAAQEASGVDREWTLDELVARGEQSYNAVCASCHQPDGSGNEPAFPALAGNQALMEERERHIETVVNGVSGAAMPAFRNTLSPVEIAAVITYERNAWGNETGDVVQPSEIAERLEE